MKISVAIPVRNEGPALPLTLQYFNELKRSVDLEVIVVDDASDPPVQRLPDGMLLVRHETRQGIARSRNAAARMATGDLLLHTDGHVFFSPGALEQLTAACDEQSLCGVRMQLIHDFAQFERRQTEGLDGPDYFGWQWTFDPEAAVVALRTLCNSEPHDVPYVGAACLAISRELFETLGGFDEGLFGCGNFEDADLAMTAWARGYRVRMLPAATCYHYSMPRPDWDRRGRSPLDVPSYDGSLCNALRILRRNLPNDWFQDLIARISRQFPVSYAALSAAFLSDITSAKSARPAWEAQRVRSREWVAQKMQGVSG